jgi:hypothetical protein
MRLPKIYGDERDVKAVKLMRFMFRKIESKYGHKNYQVAHSSSSSSPSL